MLTQKIMKKIIWFLSFTVLYGCGKTGPLYLPTTDHSVAVQHTNQQVLRQQTVTEN